MLTTVLHLRYVQITSKSFQMIFPSSKTKTTMCKIVHVSISLFNANQCQRSTPTYPHLRQKNGKKKREDTDVVFWLISPGTDLSRATDQAWVCRGERPAGRAQLRALKEGRPRPKADSGGTGTDSGCVRMRPGCFWILNSSKFRRIPAQFGQHLGKI